jgi:hypothetical protein
MSFTKQYDGEGETVSQAQIIDGVLTPNEVSANNPSKNSPGIPFGEEGLLLIPHTITQSNPVLVTVIYDLKRPTDEEWEEKKLQALLPEGTWLAGKRLTYNLIISGEKTITEFQINVVVEDWNRQPEEINFTDQAEVEETMQWVEGTYESFQINNMTLGAIAIVSVYCPQVFGAFVSAYATAVGSGAVPLPA